MPIQELGSIGELIAAVATIFTLVYLAFQINQNTRAVKASMLEVTGSRSMELAKFVANDPELTRIVTTAMTHDPELDEADKRRLQLVFIAAMRSYELTVAHEASKYLDPTEYSGLGSNLSGWVGASYFSAWWENAQVNFSKALQDQVREEMKNLPDYPTFLTPPTEGKLDV
jgi:hypothetical protein